MHSRTQKTQNPRRKNKLGDTDIPEPGPNLIQTWLEPDLNLTRTRPEPNRNLLPNNITNVNIVAGPSSLHIRGLHDKGDGRSQDWNFD